MFNDLANVIKVLLDASAMLCFVLFKNCFLLHILNFFYIYNFSFHFNSGFSVFVMCFCNFNDILYFYLALFSLQFYCSNFSWT